MGRHAQGNRLRLPHIKSVVNRLVALVHHHADHALVFIDKGSAQQVAAAENKKIALHIEIPPDIPHVLADPPKLEQVFFNLLGNSLKFTDEGGSVTLSAFEVTPPIKGGHQTSRPMIQISVADTGFGIPKNKRKLIFEKFYQIKKAMEWGKEGVGLGLAIVKRLVELHGGEMIVIPKPRIL